MTKEEIKEIIMEIEERLFYSQEEQNDLALWQNTKRILTLFNKLIPENKIRVSKRIAIDRFIDLIKLLHETNGKTKEVCLDHFANMIFLLNRDNPEKPKTDKTRVEIHIHYNNGTTKMGTDIDGKITEADLEDIAKNILKSI